MTFIPAKADVTRASAANTPNIVVNGLIILHLLSKIITNPDHYKSNNMPKNIANFKAYYLKNVP
jgi:hypothetical protein